VQTPKAWERLHCARCKHRDRGPGSQRPSGSLMIATMRAKEDVHQDDHAESERPRLTNQITTCAVVCLARDVLCAHHDRLRTSLHMLTPNFQLASPTDKPMHHNSTFMTVLIAPDPAIRDECLAPIPHWASLPCPCPCCQRHAFAFFVFLMRRLPREEAHHHTSISTPPTKNKAPT
jgi:hypothetical protein